MLYELNLPTTHHQESTFNSRLPSLPHKDYSRPLHVDCSVEYELPSQVKPPPSTDGKIDPLLMIHPCYFRKLEAQRRSPFINNLPGRGLKSYAKTPSRATRSIETKKYPRNIPEPVESRLQPMYENQYQMKEQWTPETIETQLQLAHHYCKPPSIPPAVKHDIQSCGVNSMNSMGMYNNSMDGGLWQATNRSPLAAERFPDPQMFLQTMQPTDSCNKNILTTGKYRQYLRTHRLHPYMSMSTSAFPQMGHQMQQIPCYNV